VRDDARTDRLSVLTDRMLDSYCDLEIVGHLDRCPLPGIDALVEITRELRQLLFPGFHQRRSLRECDAVDFVATRLASVHERLTEQIACTLCYADEARLVAAADDSRTGHTSADLASECDAPELDVVTQTETIVHDFLLALPRIRQLLATDVQAAYDGDPAAQNADEIICCYPGLEAVLHYRLAHELYLLGVPLIPRMMTEWTHSRTGIDIHPAARIGPGFFIDHGTGVVIGQTCEIADHVRIYQGVTLGALSFDQDADGNLVRGQKRHPTIERKVVIYANATILGGGTVVGAHSVIGAGVSVTRSVPANTVVTIEKPSLRFREAS
jgi:serine O-acetyltransferase